MAYRRRVDANQSQIVEALRGAGWYVCITSAFGNGFFDAIAAKHGQVYFCEIKDGAKVPSARKLTKPEAEMHEDFKLAGANVVILETVEQAVRLGR